MITTWHLANKKSVDTTTFSEKTLTYILMDYLLVETQAYPKSLMKASYRQFCTKASFHFDNGFRLYSESKNRRWQNEKVPVIRFCFIAFPPSAEQNKSQPEGWHEKYSTSGSNLLLRMTQTKWPVTQVMSWRQQYLAPLITEWVANHHFSDHTTTVVCTPCQPQADRYLSRIPTDTGAVPSLFRRT